MADFSLPALNSLYPNVLTELKSRDESIAKMFDGTTDTNVPVGAIKYNSANKQLEKWNGTGWTAQTISNLAADSVGASQVQNFSLPPTKIKGTSNTWFSWRNVADTADYNAIGVDASGALVLNSEGSKSTLFEEAGSVRWSVAGGSGYLLPGTTDFYNLGSSLYRVKTAYVRELANCDTIYVNGGNQWIGPLSSHALILRSADAGRWYVQNIGHFRPYANNSYDIGASAETVRNIYTRTVRSPSAISLLTDASGDSNSWVGLGVAGTQQWIVDHNGNFRPWAHFTYTIGTQTNNVSRLWTGSVYCAGGDLFTVTLGPRLQFGWNNTVGFYMENASVLGTPPSFHHITDNVAQIGIEAARFKDGYIVNLNTTNYVNAATGQQLLLRSASAHVVIQTQSLNRAVFHNDGNIEFNGQIEGPTSASRTHVSDWVVYVHGAFRRIKLHEY